MSKQLIAAMIVGRLALAPCADAAPPDGGARPLAQAATQEAARAAHAETRGPMPRRLKWAGSYLIFASGMGLLGAEMGDCLAPEETCRRGRHRAHLMLAAMAGTGIGLLVLADHKRPRIPVVVSVAPGRASIAHRITF